MVYVSGILHLESEPTAERYSNSCQIFVDPVHSATQHVCKHKRIFWDSGSVTTKT